MSDETKPTPEQDWIDAAQGGAEASEASEALRAERDELLARLQRVSADYQNYMRRSEQQTRDMIEYARGDLLRMFIPVLDHFDRALGSVGPAPDAATASLAEGMRIVRDEMLRVLGQAGAERIEVNVGDPFDPQLHQAVMRHAAEGVAANHVTMSLQPGYVYKGRTLRPAQVAVAPADDDVPHAATES